MYQQSTMYKNLRYIRNRKSKHEIKCLFSALSRLKTDIKEKGEIENRFLNFDEVLRNSKHRVDHVKLQVNTSHPVPYPSLFL
jgi:hypothetical protein